MTKAEIEKKKSLARTLYLSGMEQQEIADKVEVSRVTISKWSTAEGWKEARAAKNITRPELVNKLLLTIDALITQVNSSNDPQLIAGLSDKLAKLSAVIEKLDKKANVVDAIEVFMAFSKWLEFRSQTDPDVTPELMRVINKYQDLYITEQMGIKKSLITQGPASPTHPNPSPKAQKGLRRPSKAHPLHPIHHLPHLHHLLLQRPSKAQ